MSGDTALRVRPRRPLAPHLALPNHLLEGGVCKALPRTPSALLCYDFAVRSESSGCSRAHFPNPPGWVPFSRRLAVPGKDFRKQLRDLDLLLEQSWKRLRDEGVEREAKLQPEALSRNEKSNRRRGSVRGDAHRLEGTSQRISRVARGHGHNLIMTQEARTVFQMLFLKFIHRLNWENGGGMNARRWH
jgi:hypothetical protein